MALITLTTAKEFLDVIHSADDIKLQLLLDAAIDEAVRFIGYATPAAYEEYIDSTENPYGAVPNTFVIGALLLLQANYQAPPDDIPKLRAAAEVKLMPLRENLGI